MLGYKDEVHLPAEMQDSGRYDEDDWDLGESESEQGGKARQGKAQFHQAFVGGAVGDSGRRFTCMHAPCVLSCRRL